MMCRAYPVMIVPVSVWLPARVYIKMAVVVPDGFRVRDNRKFEDGNQFR